MRATEQAKNRYREWELEYQQKHGKRVISRPASPSLTVVPVESERSEESSRQKPTSAREDTGDFKFDKKAFFATCDWLVGVGERPEYTKHMLQRMNSTQRSSKRLSNDRVVSSGRSEQAWRTSRASPTAYRLGEMPKAQKRGTISRI